MSSNAQQEPSKVNANLKSMAGTAEETLAAAVGATGYQKAGQNLRAEADQEYKAAQAQGYAEGVVDQFTGKKDQVIGAVTGNDAQNTAGQIQKQQGKAEMNLNRPE